MRNVDTKAFRKAMIDADCETFVMLEEKTGIDRTSLSNYAKGLQKPTYESMVKIIDALHLTYEEIGRVLFCAELPKLKTN